jgi:hypothetical protein
MMHPNLICVLLASTILHPPTHGSQPMAGSTCLLLDDFSDPSGNAAFGTSWLAFTDRVMGGLSSVRARYVDESGRPHLHMAGSVSLENNGGFVQVALPLARDERPLDASEYRAVRLRVRGNGERYYVHLRTNDARAPWQYYAASFETTAEWTEVEVAFEDFEPVSLRAPLDRSRLQRIAVVAAKRAMQADLSVARIELVP